MNPRQAALLMLLCPDFIPGECMRGAMEIAGYTTRGSLNERARREFSEALRSKRRRDGEED